MNEKENEPKSELDVAWLTGEEITAKLPLVYKKLDAIFSRYLDIGQAEQKILIYWVIGANYYDAFETFPILYVNASKGSGKTRLLKLIEALLPDHLLVSNISEAALFRACEVKRGLEIDEAERMNSKEKATLRELLNACYKRGGKVLRVEGDKKKSLKEFNIYLPIVLANVWGLESVLEDRCIGIILQKTANMRIVKTLELFGQDPDIQEVKHFFEESLTHISDTLKEKVLNPFYKHLFQVQKAYTHYTDYTHSTLNTEEDVFYNSVYSVQIDGRGFELWMPFFAISWLISSVESVGSVVSVEKNRGFNEVLELAQARTKTRQEDEVTEDRDTNFAVTLYSYINSNSNTLTSQQFVTHYEQENGKTEWLSSIVFGKFLKRAGIIDKKRRLAKGYELIISVERLREYLKVRNALESEQVSKNLKNSEFERGKEANVYAICGSCGKLMTCSIDASSERICDLCKGLQQKVVVGE